MSFIKKYRNLIAVAAVFAAVTAIGNMFIGLEDIAAFSDSARQQNELMPILASALFVAAYIVVAALSLPIASILTLAAGAIFGTFAGSALVVAGATIGSTLPFWLVKHKFSDAIRMKYPEATNKFTDGVDGSEELFLLSARLAPIFPFYVTNAVSGLSSLNLRRYMAITAFGIAPGTTAYVFAGSRIEQAIASGSLLDSSILIGLAALSIVSFVGAFASKRIRDGKLSGLSFAKQMDS